MPPLRFPRFTHNRTMLDGHRSDASLSAFASWLQSIVLQSIGNPAWLVIAGYLCMVINAIPGYLVSWLGCWV